MKKTLCQVCLVIGLCAAVSAAGPRLADGASNCRKYYHRWAGQK